MTHRIYLIYDEKAACCVGTFMSLSDEAAKRSFEDLLFNWQPSVYNEHPEDFTLYALCEFSCEADLPRPVEIDHTRTARVVVHGSSYSRAFIDNERIKRRVRFEEITDSKYRDILKNKEDVSRET